MADWTNVKNKGWGQSKRALQNERVAQWKVMGSKFTSGVCNNIMEAQDYHDAANVADMMTWSCLCAMHGKEAMLADVDPYYVLVVCVCGC